MTAEAGFRAPEVVLVMARGGYRLGLWARDVVEVHPMVGVSSVPGAPDVIEGVVDAHGALVPVLDLAVRFGGPTHPARADDRLVLVESGTRLVGLHVDHDVDLVAPAEADIRSATLAEAPYAAGIVVLPDGLVLIHDVDAFLSSDEVISLDLAVTRALEGVG